MSSQESLLYSTVDEFKCYKVCSALRDWHGIKYFSAVVSGRWGVVYRLGKFVQKPDIYGAGGLLAFDHLVPAAMFAKSMYPNGLLFAATGRGRNVLYSNLDVSGYRRHKVHLGYIAMDTLVLDGWPVGTVCYNEIRLDERLPLEMEGD